MKVKMRSLNAEYKVLCRYFGEEFMKAMFNNYKGYEEVRRSSTYQEVYNEIDSII